MAVPTAAHRQTHVLRLVQQQRGKALRRYACAAGATVLLQPMAYRKPSCCLSKNMLIVQNPEESREQSMIDCLPARDITSTCELNRPNLESAGLLHVCYTSKTVSCWFDTYWQLPRSEAMQAATPSLYQNTTVLFKIAQQNQVVHLQQPAPQQPSRLSHASLVHTCSGADFFIIKVVRLKMGGGASSQ